MNQKGQPTRLFVKQPAQIFGIPTDYITENENTFWKFFEEKFSQKFLIKRFKFSIYLTNYYPIFSPIFSKFCQLYFQWEEVKKKIIRRNSRKHFC